MNLSGKNVLCVGGFGGIGYETSKILASKEVKNLVILDLSLNAVALQELQTINPHTHFIAFDITSNLESIRKVFASVFDEFERIDVFINCAGIFREALIDQTLRVNLEGPINTVVALMGLCDKRIARNRSDVTVVNVASVLGFEPHGIAAIYCTSKAGILMFTKACAKLSKETGISFIAICPGLTDTPILSSQECFMNSDSANDPFFADCCMQSPKQCALNFVRAIEMNLNGSVWILENGHMKSVEHHQIWDPKKPLQ